MNITVCVKRVPDTETRIRIAASGNEIDEGGVKYVLSPYDEFALEAALQIVEEAGSGRVTVLSFGGDATKESLRSALALGAHEAVLLKGEPTMDGWATAQVLASELEGDDAALVLFGVKAVDDDQQQVGPMVAELLGRLAPRRSRRWRSATAWRRAGARWRADRKWWRSTFRRGDGDEGQVRAPLRVAPGDHGGQAQAIAREGSRDRRARVRRGVAEYPPPRPEGRIVGEGPEATAELVRLLREEAKAI